MQSTWRSPSNIALVKYWGKYANQIPANPSISFTLSHSYTQTTVSIVGDIEHDGIDFDLYLDGELKPEFKEKVQQFLERIKEELGPLEGKKLKIETHNSFPHSSGIASSASGMSALALCLLDLRSEIGKIKELDFERKASEWARLGSGSASRSVYGPLGQWGEFSGIPESSDEYAIPYQGEVAPVFQDFHDCILLVE
jgi:diphosphomevalonate decarboxylase